MLKIIRSICLWTVGVVFFGFCSLVLILSLFIFPRYRSYRLAHYLFNILIRLMGIRLDVDGLEKTDRCQSYLIMGNHQSLFDLFVIPAALPMPFIGIQAAEHFSYPLLGFIIRKWGNIPIQRDNLEKAKESLLLARKTLESGMNICVLPEGHRTLTGQMASFKKGPFHLALQTRAPILPFGVKGLFEYQRKGDLNLHPGRVVIRFGSPIPHDAYQHLSMDELKDRVFDQIKTLSQ